MVEETKEKDTVERSRGERLAQWARSRDATPRTKLTAEDILERQEAKAAAKQAKRQQRDEQRKSNPSRTVGTLARRSVIAVCLLGAIGFGVASELGSGPHSAKMAELDGEVGTLSGQLTSAKEEVKAVSVDPKQAMASMEAAQEAAAEVARLQTQYAYHPLTTAAGPDGTAIIVGEKEFKAVNAELRKLFSEGSQNSAKLDPTLMWYQMWDYKDGKWVVAEGGDLVWSSPKVWSVIDADTVRVNWQGRETATGDLMAWATAEYDAISGTFSKLRLGITTQGQARIPPTDSTGARKDELPAQTTREPAPADPSKEGEG